jgi:hypothetical protein
LRKYTQENGNRPALESGTKAAKETAKEAGLPPNLRPMWIIPLVFAGAGVILSLSPDAVALVTSHVGGILPEEFRWKSASMWLDGHQSIGLVYLSGALFFVTRTVSRLIDK